MAKKIFYVSRTENPGTGTAGPATLNRADQPQLIKVYDTVADAEADIANIDTNEIVGTKEVDLSSYTIVNRVAGGNLNPVTSNAVANTLSYSTDETLTGGYWIDGKPIYRKVLDLDTMPNNTLKTVSTGITNADMLVHLYGACKGSNANALPLPYINTDGNNIQLWLSDNFTTLNIRTISSGWIAYSGYAIVEYTKTGD